ncbi:hypothetical protein B0H16DRAFT_1456728 [Mycena metata]|uniref:Alpha-type protein kinase domain-containing protein n=1 Tax=Mycena metata TaxID=1033252 RepID=A0AAD7NFI6_9AGAR|nr:hypothetical protein B0H16DRAFT_1456728 [Mycena metata]
MTHPTSIFDPDLRCPRCNRPDLGPLLQCQGRGKDVLNYNRPYQRCQCGAHLWYGPKAALEDIPEHVQLEFAIKKSLAENNGTGKDNGVFCSESTCRNSQGGARRANLQCGRTPIQCATCCKANGGCPAHPLSARDVPTAASSSGRAAPLANPPRSIHARPLNASYAMPYARAHNHLFRANAKVEQEATQQEILANTFTVVLYKKDAPAPAEHFKLVAENRRFVPANHPAIAVFAQNGLVAVLESRSPPKWINHDVRVGIPVTTNTRILLKVLDVVNCADLELELPPLPLLPSPLSSTSLLRVDPKPIPSHPDLELRPIEPLTSSLDLVVAKKKRFPLRYTCDMEPRIHTLVGVKGQAIAAAFMHAFPGMLYKKGTVYKHISFYSDAVKLGLVRTFSDQGRTDRGQWKLLVSAVEASRKRGENVSQPELMVVDLTQGRTTPAELELTVAGEQQLQNAEGGPQNMFIYDELVEHTTLELKMKQYKKVHGVIQDYGPDDCAPLAFDIFTHFVPGSRFNVHLANFVHPEFGRIACAFKNMRDDQGNNIWVEGARWAEGHFLWEGFKNVSAAANILLPDIEFASTSLLTDPNPAANTYFYLAQPFYNGTRLNSCDFDADTDEFRTALSAFSHWTYKISNYNSVYVEFEGFMLARGYRVFDSKTHTLDSRNNPFGYDFLRSQGEQGVKAFRDTHNCNAICARLRLDSLPVVFPPPVEEEFSTQLLTL